MNNKFSCIAVAAALGILTIVISGCSSRNSFVEHGVASVETKPSTNVEILRVDVYRDGEEIIVCGVV